MSDTVLARVARVIHETFGDASVEITRDTVAEDVPGWDSLSHTILTLALEDEFRIGLPPASREFTNVGELVDNIERLMRLE